MKIVTFDQHYIPSFCKHKVDLLRLHSAQCFVNYKYVYIKPDFTWLINLLNTIINRKKSASLFHITEEIIL